MATAIENNVIEIDLLTACNTTGWVVNTDGSASHTSCNAGNITLDAYPLTAGTQYQISYIVLSISGGNIQPISPGSNGIARTTAGVYVETISPTSNGFLSLYSNATCQITGFNINPISTLGGATIVYSAINSAKRGEAIWTDFRTLYPDFGWSLYTRSIIGYQGQLYDFDGDNSVSANNFFGVQYQSIIKFADAKNAGLVKDYEALSYQANQLLVSTIDGIQTSTGQVSTLIDTDFIKQFLTSGGQTVIINQNDGVYSASFLGDENTNNVVNGDALRGNYIIIELITDDGSTPLILFSISVRSKTVFLGSRPLT